MFIETVIGEFHVGCSWMHLVMKLAATHPIPTQILSLVDLNQSQNYCTSVNYENSCVVNNLSALYNKPTVTTELPRMGGACC